MNSLVAIIWAVFYLAIPAGVIWLCRRSKAAAKAGAILILYFVGLIAGNFLIYPFPGMAETVFPVQDALSSITIPLALPLILFACNFRGWPVRKALVSLIIGLVSVIIVASAGYWIFGKQLGPEAAHIAGMTVGVYTGGTPNLAAVKMMLGVPESTYLIMNSLDMLVSFAYLVFLMAIGIRLARRILPAGTLANVTPTAANPANGTHAAGTPEAANPANETPAANTPGGPIASATSAGHTMARDEFQMYRGILARENRAGTLKAFGLAVAIAGIGIGLSLLLTGEINMIVLILTLTTLAIAASFLPSVRKWEKSYDAGMYLVLVFSVVVASMVDIRSLNLADCAYMTAYLAFAIFGSLMLQVLFSKLFKVDADTAIITSVAMINSPLFVPMIADRMNNRKVILTGITIGIIGYAVGNYLGVLLASLLSA